MILKKMTKKDWIIYSIRMIVFIMVWFGVKIYKDNHHKNQNYVSALDLCSGEYQLLTAKQEHCGNIDIKSNKDSIIVSFKGDQIKGEDSIGKNYVLDSIEYENITMTVNTINSETYYFYKTENSYILLLKIKNDPLFVNHFDLKKNAKLFLLCELYDEDYEFLLEYANSMELYKRCYVRIDSSRYSSFFIQ